MLGQRTSPSRIVAGIAAAATTGALIAMGRRAGGIGLPFAAIGAVLTHEMPRAGAMLLVAIGVGLHLIASFVWASIFVRFERVLARPWMAASVVALLQFLVAWVVARATGTGVASVLPLGDRIVFAVVMAIALVVGMRLARVMLRNA